MRTLHINDTEYGPDEVRYHRKNIIQLRDEALKNNLFDWALILSVEVGLLHELAKMLEEA